MPTVEAELCPLGRHLSADLGGDVVVGGSTRVAAIRGERIYRRSSSSRRRASRPVHPRGRGVVTISGLVLIRPHDLRHTYATLALKGGVHPKVVSERLGDATVGITLDLYSHVTPAIARDAAKVVAQPIFE